MPAASQLDIVDDDRRDPETGQYTERFSDADIIEIVSKREPVGTNAIANILNCSQQAAYQRLRSLEDAKKISSDKIGGTRVWMLPK